MTNWKNISPDFTPELQKEWENRGFDYNQVWDWINIGLQPNDYNFANYLQNNCGRKAETILNEGNLESLRKEYQEELDTQQALSESLSSLGCNNCVLKEKELEDLQVTLIALQESQPSNSERVVLKRENDNLQRQLNSLRTSNQQLTTNLQVQQANFTRLQAEFNQKSNNWVQTERDLKQKHLEELRVRERSCNKQKEELANRIRELESEMKECKVDSEWMLEMEDKVEELKNSLKKVKQKLSEWVELVGERKAPETKKGWFW